MNREAARRAALSETNMRELLGSKFWKLTILGIERRGIKNGFLTQCECGTIHWVAKWFLENGKTTSCGCWKKINVAHLRVVNKTHGMTKTRAFRIWTGMKTRCHNERSDNYHNYGALGIKVCDRWRESFVQFLSDMGNPPSPKHSLDRFPNQNGDYSLDNCRWATSKQQARNSRHNRTVTAFGESKTAIEWSEDPRCKVHRGTLYCRLHKGWADELAITKPAGNNGRKKTTAVT